MKYKQTILSLLLFALMAGCQPANLTGATQPTNIATVEIQNVTNTQAPAIATLAPTLTPATSAPTVTSAAPQSIHLTDGLGRSVDLAGPALRVISLAPSNTEILYAISAGSQVIGRDDFSDYPVEAKALPSIGGSNSKYNLEAIAALKPDLVLAAELNTPEQVKALEGLNLNVYYLKNPTDLDGLYANLETVATLTGKQVETEKLVAGLKSRVAAVQKAVENVKQTPTVYYELDATDPSKPYTSGPGTFVDTLIHMAGGKNVASDLGSAWAAISSEALIAKNPDIILLGDGAYGVTIESLSQRPGWANIQALVDKRVYVFDDNTVSRPTPRLVDGLETLAKLIHPEAFQ